jgi:hypothetical protein
VDTARPSNREMLAQIDADFDKAFHSKDEDQMKGWVNQAVLKSIRFLGPAAEAVPFTKNAEALVRMIRSIENRFYDNLLTPSEGPKTYSIVTDSAAVESDYPEELAKLRRRVEHAPGLRVENVLLVVSPSLANDPAGREIYRKEHGAGFDNVIFVGDRSGISDVLNSSKNPAVFVTASSAANLKLHEDKAIAVQLQIAGSRLGGVMGDAWTQSLMIRMSSGDVTMPGVLKIGVGIYRLQLLGVYLAQLLKEVKERTEAVGSAA